ncbi:type IV pilin protein [Pseudoalteromonas sp. MMG023]|nr:type IV pilin protein [Pseudoalteromonas sp. MMG024]
MSALLDIANRQEQHYADNHEYTNNLQRLRVATTTEKGMYAIKIVSDGSSFTATATPNDTPATKDEECTSFSINDLGQKQATGTIDSSKCWGK